MKDKKNNIDDKTSDNQNSFEKEVYNPRDRENFNKYYDIQRKTSSKKSIVGVAFTIIYICALFVMMFLNPIIFLILFFVGIILLLVYNAILKSVEKKRQEKNDKFMIENIDQLKVYDATVRLITASVIVGGKKNQKSYGHTIYCEVNGKYLKKNTEVEYSKDMPIKIYMHDKIPNYFLTEEEYLHAKMKINNK